MATLNLTPELLATLPIDGQQSFEIEVDVPSDWSAPNA
jgi:hypothetical protein